MSLKQKSIRALFWTLSGQVALGAIALVIDIYLTRLLTPADFGLIGMIIFFMTIGETLIDGGMTSSLIRTREPDDADYTAVFYFNVFASLVIYSGFYLLAPAIASFYGQPALTSITRVYTLGFVIIALTAVQQTRMTKQMDFKTQTRIQIIAKTIAGAAAILFTILGYGVWSLVFFYLINQTALSVQFWIHSGWYPGIRFNYARSGHHFRYGYKLTLSALLDAVVGNVYYLIIGRFFSASISGFYTKANQLKQMPVNIISGALSRVTFPLFSSIQDQPEQLKRAYRKIMQQAIFWIAPLLLGAAVLAAPLFELVFTEKWLPAVPYFQILCTVGILYPIHSYNLNILKVFGRSDLFLRLEITKKVLVVINVAVAIRFGIFALLIGQVVVSNIAFLINSYYSGRFINYTARDQVRDILPILGLAMGMSALVLVLDQYALYGMSNLPRLIIASATGATVYLSLAKYFGLEAYGEFWVLLGNLRDMVNVKRASLNI